MAFSDQELRAMVDASMSEEQESPPRGQQMMPQQQYMPQSPMGGSPQGTMPGPMPTQPQGAPAPQRGFLSELGQDAKAFVFEAGRTGQQAWSNMKRGYGELTNNPEIVQNATRDIQQVENDKALGDRMFPTSPMSRGIGRVAPIALPAVASAPIAGSGIFGSMLGSAAGGAITGALSRGSDTPTTDTGAIAKDAAFGATTAGAFAGARGIARLLTKTRFNANQKSAEAFSEVLGKKITGNIPKRMYGQVAEDAANKAAKTSAAFDDFFKAAAEITDVKVPLNSVKETLQSAGSLTDELVSNPRLNKIISALSDRDSLSIAETAEARQVMSTMKKELFKAGKSTAAQEIGNVINSLDDGLVKLKDSLPYASGTTRQTINKLSKALDLYKVSKKAKDVESLISKSINESDRFDAAKLTKNLRDIVMPSKDNLSYKNATFRNSLSKSELNKLRDLYGYLHEKQANLLRPVSGSIPMAGGVLQSMGKMQGLGEFATGFPERVAQQSMAGMGGMMSNTPNSVGNLASSAIGGATSLMDLLRGKQ